MTLKHNLTEAIPPSDTGQKLSFVTDINYPCWTEQRN